MKNNTVWFWVIITLINPLLQLNAQSNIKTKKNALVIQADPDVRISFDGNIPHMEAYIAASSINPDVLFACGELVIPGRYAYRTEARIYYSNNNGAIWNPVLLPEEISGGWDNAITGGIDGIAYFLTSNSTNGLTLYGSLDNGKSWRSTIIKGTSDWDRPHMVVDHSKGQFRGRLYIVAESGKGAAIVHSSDQGLSFSSPAIAYPSAKGRNIAITSGPLILSDGTLILPCAPYPDFPARSEWAYAEAGLVSSSNGGISFSEYQPIFTFKRALPRHYYKARMKGEVLSSGNFMPGPSFAVAPAGASFQDRLYAVWQEIDSTGQSSLLFSYAEKLGDSWNMASPIDAFHTTQGKMAKQGVPMIGVNGTGIVGVAWYDSRFAKTNSGYDVLFSASSDGGISFVSPIRLSSETSYPAQSNPNTLPAFSVAKPAKDGVQAITMISAFSTRATGSDYSTMAVDANGRFHPLWTDARSGSAWQLYTAAIRVLPEHFYESNSGEKQSVNNILTDTVDRRLNLQLEEPSWELERKRLQLPIRLFNNSSDTIVGTIVVKIFRPDFTNSRARQYASSVKMPKLSILNSGIWADSIVVFFEIPPTAPLYPKSITAKKMIQMKVENARWMDFSLKAVVLKANNVKVSSIIK